MTLVCGLPEACVEPQVRFAKTECRHLGPFHFLSPSDSQLAPLILVMNILGIGVLTAVTVSAHPTVESGVLGWQWCRHMGGPEFAALGWTKKHA